MKRLLLHVAAFVAGMAFLIAGTIGGDGALVAFGCAILVAPYVLGDRDPPDEDHGRGAA